MLLKTDCNFMLENKLLHYVTVIGPSVQSFKKIASAEVLRVVSVRTTGFNLMLIIQSSLATIDQLLAMDPSTISVLGDEEKRGFTISV